jgi:hypothetical protein
MRVPPSGAPHAAIPQCHCPRHGSRQATEPFPVPSYRVRIGRRTISERGGVVK